METLLLLGACAGLAKPTAGHLASRRFLFQALDIGYQLMPAASTWPGLAWPGLANNTGRDNRFFL
jgi:hypothetical protein